MNNILSKVLTSSADPSRVSLLIRGVLMSFAPMVMLVLGITEADFGSLVDGIVEVVFFATSLIAALQMVWGGVRKINLGRWSHPDAQ